VALLNDFLLGCDPEFVGLGRGGTHIPLQQFFHDRGNNRIGVDHNGAVGELRPEAAKSAATIVRRLAGLINDPLIQNLDMKLRAGAYVELPGALRRPFITLGGHVHLDMAPFELKTAKRKYKRLRATADGGRAGNIWDGVLMSNDEPADVWRARGYELDEEEREEVVERKESPRLRQMLKALDAFTERLESLDILPRNESERRREDSEYGQFSQYRTPTSDRIKYRTEYRTMASWLYSPKVAMLCLTGAKLAAQFPIEFIQLLQGPMYRLRRLQSTFDEFKSRDSDAATVASFLEPCRLNNVTKLLGADPDVDIKLPWKQVGDER